MLPKNKIPTYECVLPVSKKTVTYRPWVSVESKKILTALMSKDLIEIETAIVSVLDACTFNTVDFNTIPYADIEFLFIKVKIKSKGEIIDLTYQATKERDDSQELIPVELNLNEAQLTPIPDTTILIDETQSLGVKMRFPTIGIIQQMRSEDTDFKKVCLLIETVFDEKQVYDRSLFTDEELVEWVENLTDTQMEKILEFLTKIPTVKQTIKFRIGKKEKEIELSGLQDFFL